MECLVKGTSCSLDSLGSGRRTEAQGLLDQVGPTTLCERLVAKALVLVGWGRWLVVVEGWGEGVGMTVRFRGDHHPLVCLMHRARGAATLQKKQAVRVDEHPDPSPLFAQLRCG